MSRRIGPAPARRMMMTARSVDAAEALALGLVDMLADGEGPMAMAQGLAADILANSWHTNFAAKRLQRETDGMGLDAALAYEQAHYPGYAPDWQLRIARFTK